MNRSGSFNKRINLKVFPYLKGLDNIRNVDHYIFLYILYVIGCFSYIRYIIVKGPIIVNNSVGVVAIQCMME